MLTIASYGILILLSIFLLFHFLILFKVIPFTIVWGGRLKSEKEMYRFETVSILINSLFIFICLIQCKFIDIEISKKLMTLIFWIIAALFFLNTIGNLLSKNKFERMFFTPITLILSFFAVFIALS